jgi:hypothetical protein
VISDHPYNAEYLPAAFYIARSVIHVQIIQLWRASPAGLPHRAREHVVRKSKEPPGPDRL